MKKMLLFAAMFLSLSLFCQCACAEGRIVSDVMKNGERIVHYQPDETVCAVDIEVHTRGDVITYYRAVRGCSGNSRGIGALVKGMKVDEAISRLEGIPCGNRPTSCPDQLAQALKAMKKSSPDARQKSVKK